MADRGVPGVRGGEREQQSGLLKGDSGEVVCVNSSVCKRSNRRETEDSF